jgi:type I restriction enzyme, S subunit
MSSAQVPEGYKQTEIGLIPEDWEVVPLGKFLNFQNGVNANKASYGHGIPFINISEVMARTHLTYSDIPGLVSLSKQATDLYRVYQGDILFNRTSEVQEELGLTSVYLGDEIVVFGGFVIRGRQSTETLEITYSSYALRSTSIRNQIIARGQGAIRANIGQKDLSEIQICIPPLPEQRAIAQALSDVDALIASLDRLIAKQRHLKTAAMQQLLTGKMRLPGFGGSWRKVILGNECSLITKGTTPTSLGHAFKEQGINFIKIESVTEDGNILFEKLAYIDAATHALLNRSQLQEKDILFSIAGALGRCALVENNLLPANTNQALAIIRLKTGTQIEHEFLLTYLKSTVIQKYIDTINVQAAQANLSLENINNFEIIIPSIEEQRAITTVLSDMDTAIAALETRRTKTQAIKQGMMQELLTGRTRLV